MKRKVLIALLAAAMVSGMSVPAVWAAEDTKTEAAADEAEDTKEDGDAKAEADEKDDTKADAEADKDGEAKEDAAGGKVEFDAEPEFEPNKDYDKYTVVKYTIEDLNTDIIATVSAKADDSEFEILCNFFGDDQQAIVSYDGKEFKVTKDKTGFMEGDSPKILEKALEQNKWANTADGTAFGVEGGAADAAFDVEPQFEPNKDYDKYTVLEYTIEDLNTDMVVTVSAKEDDSEFEILCNFFGDDQQAVVSYDGKEFKVTKDKTGFMEGDSPKILEKALEQDKWAPIEK